MTAITNVSFQNARSWLSLSRRRGARWFRQMAAEWKRGIAPAPLRPAVESWTDDRIHLAWLGHSTVLINFFGLRILTDPVLGSRVGIRLGIGTAGPKRCIAPALRTRELPPVDVVLLSHAHLDHMDLATLHRLKSPSATVTARDTSDVLARTRLGKLVELGWGEATVCRSGAGELRVQAFEVRHWGKRWPSERNRGYNGYILEREGHRLLFGGDTALTPAFRALRSRGPFDIAIMPIGAYNPWIGSHCTPEEALSMADAAGAEFVFPIHHQTFRLSEEPMGEPIARLQQALSRDPERLAVREVGETFVVPEG